MGSGRTPGGPLSGGMQENNLDALKAIQQHREAPKEQPVQHVQENAVEQKPPSSPAEREAAAIQKNLEQNDRIKESRDKEIALRRIGKDLAPNDKSIPEQQAQLRGGPER